MKLNAQFLPVGSIVSQNNTPLIVMGLTPPEPRQDERFSDKWVVSTCGFNVPMDDCEPIPLTPEILTEWCNMKLERKQLSLNIGGELFEYAIDSKNFCIYYSKLKGWTLDGRVTKDTVFIQFLHQLQHLYSALTQQVLTVKIK